MSEFFGENHCSRDNRTRQSTAASFVNPGNASHANGAELFFITKSTAPVHPRKSSADLREVTSDM
jgi:hypothetical protein